MFRTRHYVVLTAIAIFIITAVILSETFVPASNQSRKQCTTTIIIDAGHGGEDGGASSCSGILESQINLEIAERLNDLMHLLGYNTIMTRTEDISIYTEGTTLSQKKVSDLKERVRIANTTESAVLISIHQNQYPDDRYHGAQVFYAPTKGSRTLAENMQTIFVTTINPGSKRRAKSADGIYLMQKVACPAILVECGFLSNREEEILLRSKEYQVKICSIIAASVSSNAENCLLS